MPGCRVGASLSKYNCVFVAILLLLIFRGELVDQLNWSYMRVLKVLYASAGAKGKGVLWSLDLFPERDNGIT